MASVSGMQQGGQFVLRRSPSVLSTGRVPLPLLSPLNFPHCLRPGRGCWAWAGATGTQDSAVVCPPAVSSQVLLGIWEFLEGRS